MTDGIVSDKLLAMRALLISAAFAALAVMSAPAQAACDVPLAAAVDAPLVPIAAEEAVEPARLAPLAEDSPWRARFEAAADELFPALRSGNWQPLMGGQWLGEGDRRVVAALLADRCGAFAPLLSTSRSIERRIFGWVLPDSYNSTERAEIAARPEAEALVCWAVAGVGDDAWPRTAVEADNEGARPYACARIAYSLRGGVPRWRAFVERG